MKTSMILLLCAAIVLVAAEDKKGPASHQDAKQHESYGQQQQQHQLKQQQSHDQHHQSPASQQHQLKQNQPQQPQQHPQPASYKHKRETPKNTAEGHSTTAAPKAAVDPKQPSILPAVVGQAPKNKRDTVAAQPAARPATNAPPKAAATNSQQRKPQSASRPTGAKLNRDQPSNTAQSATNAKAPATVNQQSSSSTTASPNKKL